MDDPGRSHGRLRQRPSRVDRPLLVPEFLLFLLFGVSLIPTTAPPLSGMPKDKDKLPRIGNPAYFKHHLEVYSKLPRY